MHHGPEIVIPVPTRRVVATGASNRPERS